MIPFNKRRFWIFHSAYWIVAGVALFLYGLRYGHWEIALIRNIYNPLLGFILSLVMSVIFANKIPRQGMLRLSFVLGAAIAGGLISSLVVNPITYALLGHDIGSLSAADLFTDALYFSLFYLVWSLLFLQISNLPLFPPPASKSAIDETKSPQLHPIKTITVEKSGTRLKLHVDDITHIGANGDYVELFTPAESYMKLGTIGSFETALGGDKFRRIHRSIIVNIDKIRSITGPSKGQYRITLEGGQEVRSSRTAQSSVESFLPKAN